MKPPVESIRLTNSEKELLVRAKRKTSIDSWNVLCRWALLLGLSDNSIRIQRNPEKRDSVEIKWDTFAGKWSDAFSAAIYLQHQRQLADSPNTTVFEFFHAKLEGGIRQLTKLTNDKGLNAFDSLTGWPDPQKVDVT